MNTQNQSPELQNLVMTAPVSTSDYEKKDKAAIEKISVGNHLGRLYGIVDLGEQLNTMFNKRSTRIALLFEFPHLMQDFYVRKPGEIAELKPTMIKLEENYSMHPKSNFRKLIETAIGRKMNDDEAEKFNIFSILGQWFTCNVMHDPDKKDPNNVYERINFLQPYDDRFRVAGVNYNGENQLMAYSIQIHGFSGKNWQGLWNKFRTTIMDSTQGREWANKGGKFEEVKYDENGNITTNMPGGYQGPSAPAGNNPMQGQPQSQHQQNTTMSQPTNVPQSPAPTPLAPVAVQKQFVIKTPPMDIRLWEAENWTKEMMVQEGHAAWVESPV